MSEKTARKIRRMIWDLFQRNDLSFLCAWHGVPVGDLIAYLDAADAAIKGQDFYDTRADDGLS